MIHAAICRWRFVLDFVLRCPCLGVSATETFPFRLGLCRLRDRCVGFRTKSPADRFGPDVGFRGVGEWGFMMPGCLHIEWIIGG